MLYDRISSGRSSIVTASERPVTTDRSMTFSSSRTLPGHEYSDSSLMASGDSCFATWWPLPLPFPFPFDGLAADSVIATVANA